MAPRTGVVASVDVFYNTDADYAERWRNRGVLAFEMEPAALFFLAARAGAQAGCALIVGDVLGPEATGARDFMSAEDLNRAVDRMVGVALEAGTGLAVDSST